MAGASLKHRFNCTLSSVISGSNYVLIFNKIPFQRYGILKCIMGCRTKEERTVKEE